MNKQFINGKFYISYQAISIILFYSFDFMYLGLMYILPSNEIAKLCATFILYSFFVLAVLKKPKIFKKDALILIFINVFIFAFNYLIHPEYGYAMFSLPTWNIFNSVFCLSSGMFAYLFFRMENSGDKLLSYLKYMAYILFAWGLVRIMSSLQSGGFSRISSNGNVLNGSYDMSVGYRMLFVSIVFLVEYWRNKGSKKYFYLIISLTALILMVIFGSRTAFVSFVVFIILYFMFGNYEENKANRFYFKIGIFMLLLLGYLFISNENTLIALSNLLNRYGLNSRMLDTIVTGSVSLDNGRNRIWTTVWKMILEHPIIGNGVYADRYAVGIYCHQILLELWLDFGIVIGTLFVFTLIIGVSRMLFKCHNKNWKLLFIIFFSLTVVRLSVSYSFWYDTNFWICMAIYMNYIEEKNLKKRHRIIFNTR